MANIPVQRKSGIPAWVWWIVALLLLGLLAAFLLGLFDREAAPATTGAQATPATAATGADARAQPTAAGAAVVTDVPIGQPDRLVALVGRDVRLDGVRVQQVVGDRAFWIGPSDTQRLFVVLNDEAQTPGKVEGKVDVNQGQTVNIEGEIRRLPAANQAQQELGIDPNTFDQVKDQQVYLFARRVQITSR